MLSKAACSYASLVYRTIQKIKNKKITKNEKPLIGVNTVQYSPRRQSRWVLADYGGKRFVEKLIF